MPLTTVLMPDLTMDADTVATLRTMVENDGTERTCKAIGVSRDTLLRVLAALPVRKGTVLLIRESLTRLARPA